MTSRNEVGGGRVVGAVARVDGGPGESHCEHGLAHARWPDQQHVGRVIDEPQRRELADHGLVDRGLRGEVEVVEPPGHWQSRESLEALFASPVRRFDLDGQELVQELGVAELLRPRLVELLGKRLGGRREPQVRELCAHLLVERVARHRCPLSAMSSAIAW